jgi:hypothetical protein
MTGDFTTNNVELTNLAKKMKLNLVGIYSKDKLPDKCFVGSYIINLEDDDAGLGSHWVGLYITPKKEVLYFDSFGMPPPIEVKEFVSYKPVAMNTRQIQNVNSTLCGFYCLFFLKYIETNMKNQKKNIYEVYDDFLNIFRYDTIKNENIVKRYFGL